MSKDFYKLKCGFNIFIGIEQKGMTFDHEFGYSFPLFSSLLKKRKEEKEEEKQKSRSKVMPFCSIAMDPNQHL